MYIFVFEVDDVDRFQEVAWIKQRENRRRKWRRLVRWWSTWSARACSSFTAQSSVYSENGAARVKVGDSVRACVREVRVFGNVAGSGRSGGCGSEFRWSSSRPVRHNG